MSYVFWMFAEVAANLAIPRLVLFPLAAYYIGKEQFGVFMTAMSLALILGTQLGEGLSTGLLKHLSDYPEQQRMQFCGTALRMCQIAMAIVVVLILLAITGVGIVGWTPWEILRCLIPLIISLYPENQFMLILAESRFHRRFRGRAVWSLLRTVGILICGLIGIWAYGATGLALGFMAGNTTAYIVLRFSYRDWYKQPFSPAMASVLKTIWFQITIAGMITLSGPYLNRIILSIMHSYNDTADLVAATSVTFLFTVPVTCLGGLLLSMISRYSSVSQFSRRGRILYLIALLFGMTVMPVALKLLGPFTTHLMFPKFGDTSIGLFSILIWSIPSETLSCFARPFVIKFASIRLVPIINAISMTATLLPAICLIPRYSTKGAALAVVIGSITTSILWGSGAAWVFCELLGWRSSQTLN
jgi:O-antigen/teichoic acid export membrane protein